MSIFKEFSVSHNIERSNNRKKKQAEERRRSIAFDSNKPALTTDLITPLVEFGYDLEQIVAAFKSFQFTMLEDAILYMTKDSDTGKYTHPFIEKEGMKNQRRCKICLGREDEHVDMAKIEENIEFNTEYAKDTKINNLDFEISMNTTENNLLKDSSVLYKKKLEKSPIKSNAPFVPAKINIPEDTLNMWEDPNTCRICFAETVETDKNLLFSCGHKFCKKCVRSHLQINISNSNVLHIKCLYGGCQRIFLEEEIKKFVDGETFRKYKRFKNFQERVADPQKMYVNCPIVDCEEIVDCEMNPDSKLFLECLMGHKFCAQCRTEGWHKRKNCQNFDLLLLQQIKSGNSDSVNFKQCPKCFVVIEKNEGCNHMTCTHCNYEFCWLCMKEYTDLHYAIYNVTGCPGMKYDTESTRKIKRNCCLKFWWFVLSFFLGVFGLALVLVFFCLFGCAYEFVKCYVDKDEEEEHSYRVDEENSVEIAERKEDKEERLREERKKNCKMISLMIFLGVICQPIYLIFYFLYGLMECYRRFNCWFYYGVDF